MASWVLPSQYSLETRSLRSASANSGLRFFPFQIGFFATCAIVHRLYIRRSVGLVGGVDGVVDCFGLGVDPLHLVVSVDDEPLVEVGPEPAELRQPHAASLDVDGLLVARGHRVFAVG